MTAAYYLYSRKRLYFIHARNDDVDDYQCTRGTSSYFTSVDCSGLNEVNAQDIASLRKERNIVALD